jgi:hypothetical protein
LLVTTKSNKENIYCDGKGSIPSCLNNGPHVSRLLDFVIILTILVLFILVISELEVTICSCILFLWVVKNCKNEFYHNLGLRDYSETSYSFRSLFVVVHSQNQCYCYLLQYYFITIISLLDKIKLLCRLDMAMSFSLVRCGHGAK